MTEYGCSLELILPVRDFNNVMERIGEHEVFVKLFRNDKQEKILDYVKSMPAKGPERAEKESIIECIIVRYDGRDYYTKNPSTIGALIEAAIEDIVAREELQLEAKKHGFDLFQPKFSQP